MDCIESTVQDLSIKESAVFSSRKQVDGVILENGEKVTAKSIVLTTGTFLGGIVHIGENSYKAGRIGESSSSELANTLSKFHFSLGRLRTGD